MLCNCRGLWSTQGPHETLCTNTQIQHPVLCSINIYIYIHIYVNDDRSNKVESELAAFKQEIMEVAKQYMEKNCDAKGNIKKAT